MIDEEFRAGQPRRRSKRSASKAQEQNVAILRTPNGIVMAPMHDGEVVKPEVPSTALPEEMPQGASRQSVSRRCRKSWPPSYRDRAEVRQGAPARSSSELNAEFAQARRWRMRIDDVRAQGAATFADLGDAMAFVDNVERDLDPVNVGLFLVAGSMTSSRSCKPAGGCITGAIARFRRYHGQHHGRATMKGPCPDRCTNPTVRQRPELRFTRNSNPTYAQSSSGASSTSRKWVRW